MEKQISVCLDYDVPVSYCKTRFRPGFTEIPRFGVGGFSDNPVKFAINLSSTNEVDAKMFLGWFKCIELVSENFDLFLDILLISFL